MATDEPVKYIGRARWRQGPKGWTAEFNPAIPDRYMEMDIKGQMPLPPVAVQVSPWFPVELTFTERHGPPAYRPSPQLVTSIQEWVQSSRHLLDTLTNDGLLVDESVDVPEEVRARSDVLADTSVEMARCLLLFRALIAGGNIVEVDRIQRVIVTRELLDRDSE